MSDAERLRADTSQLLCNDFDWCEALTMSIDACFPDYADDVRADIYAQLMEVPAFDLQTIQKVLDNV